MEYRPCFKHVILKPVVAEPKETAAKFVLPEAAAPEHSSWIILDFANDCQVLTKGSEPSCGKTVVVNHHMVQKIVLDGREIWIAPEHAIILISQGESK